MVENEIVAERSILFEFPDGASRLATLRIAKPFPHDKGDWACYVTIDGIFTPSRPIFGIDSWQALMLGRSILMQLVQTQVAAGATLHYPDTREAISVDELFGPPGLN